MGSPRKRRQKRAIATIVGGRLPTTQQTGAFLQNLQRMHRLSPYAGPVGGAKTFGGKLMPFADGESPGTAFDKHDIHSGLISSLSELDMYAWWEFAKHASNQPANDTIITLKDAKGVTHLFEVNDGGGVVNNSVSDGTDGSADGNINVDQGADADGTWDNFVVCVNARLDMHAIHHAGTDKVIITQKTAGASGNTGYTIAGTHRMTVTYTNGFSGGSRAEAVDHYFFAGTAARTITSTSGVCWFANGPFTKYSRELTAAKSNTRILTIDCAGMETATNYLHLAVVADMLDSATDDEIRIFDDDSSDALTNVIPTPLSGDSTGALYWPAVTGSPHADNQRTIAAFKIAVAAGTDINAGVLITITLPNVVDDYTLGKGFAVHWFLDDYVA